jgi:hypothetical protein
MAERERIDKMNPKDIVKVLEDLLERRCSVAKAEEALRHAIHCCEVVERIDEEKIKSICRCIIQEWVDSGLLVSAHKKWTPTELSKDLAQVIHKAIVVGEK